MATALLTSADALLSDSLEVAVPWGPQDTYSKVLGTVYVAAHVHSMLVEQHVEARELAAYVRARDTLDVASAVGKFSPSREPSAKKARSTVPRPAYVGSYMASVPEGAPCFLGLEPEVARSRGSVLGRPHFGLYPCPICSSPLPAHARGCYSCRVNRSDCLTEACWECDLCGLGVNTGSHCRILF